MAALQQLHQALFSSSIQVDALQRLSSLWPRLVALLWDPQHAVCAAAAAPVGALGALAAQAAAAQQAQRGVASAAGGMLFDWLLPLLSSQASPQGTPLTTQQLGAILLALRNCLAGDWGCQNDTRVSRDASCIPAFLSGAAHGCRVQCISQLAPADKPRKTCWRAVCPSVRPPARSPPAGVDAVTLARYANAVFEACQGLLEAEATSPQLVPPLLEVVMQAS